MKMRIVGLNIKDVWVQTRFDNVPIVGGTEKINYTGWEQHILPREEFEQMIREERPHLIEEYKKSHTHLSLTNWLYHYNETEEMIRKGIAAEF